MVLMTSVCPVKGSWASWVCAGWCRCVGSDVRPEHMTHGLSNQACLTRLTNTNNPSILQKITSFHLPDCLVSLFFGFIYTYISCLFALLNIISSLQYLNSSVFVVLLPHCRLRKCETHTALSVHSLLSQGVISWSCF